MRFVKQAFLKNKFVVDKTVFVDINGNVSFGGGRGGIQVSVGTTDDRPSTPLNGTIRYNTDINDLEVYTNNNWETLRTDRAGNIIVQNLGTGDSNITDFGPLNPTPKAAENILVLVENVMQIAGVNYTLIQGGSGKLIRFDSAVPFGKDVTVIHNFDR